MHGVEFVSAPTRILSASVVCTAPVKKPAKGVAGDCGAAPAGTPAGKAQRRHGQSGRSARLTNRRETPATVSAQTNGLRFAWQTSWRCALPAIVTSYPRQSAAGGSSA